MNRITLSQVCNYSDDSIQVSELNLNNFISTDNMLPNRGGVTEAVNLPPANNCSAYSKGEILISNIRPYFKKIWFAEFDGGCSADVLVLKTTNPKFDPKFVYYNLFQDLFFKHQMTGSKGSKMPRGDKDQIMTFLIPEFDKTYQKRVSEFLTVIDEKIALNKKINTELENLAKTIYNYWFVQFDFPNEEGKPYKTSGGEMEWNEELKREIPKGWEVNKLGNYCDLIRGVTYNNDDRLEKLTEDSIAILRATNIQSGVIDLDNMIIVPSKLVSDEQKLKKYDILITMSSGSKAHVGKNAFYFYDDEVSFGAFCSKISAKEKMKLFVFCFMQSSEFKNYINKISLGTNINNLTNELVNDSAIIIPKPELIKMFEDKVKSVYERIGINLQQNQELIHLRDFLLPLLMNGQVKIKSEAKEQLSMAAEPQVKYGK